MYELTLTGAQKSHLRGLGQTLPDHLKVGKAGLTTEFFGELQKFLRTQELVKLRFLGADREERADLCARRRRRPHGAFLPAEPGSEGARHPVALTRWNPRRGSGPLR